MDDSTIKALKAFSAAAWLLRVVTISLVAAVDYMRQSPDFDQALFERLLRECREEFGVTEAPNQNGDDNALLDLLRAIKGPIQ